MLSIVFVNTNGNYTDFIQSQAITQKNLQFAIIIASLVLISATALLSWLISLYSSFRIAGPLYRFTHNLRHFSNTKKIIPIRSHDQLQVLSQKIIHAAEKIDSHKESLLNHIDACQQLLNDHDNPQKQQQLAELLLQLKQLDTKIKLNE
ncbi:MAG: hypothetical protein OEY43_00285 [Gammaproteobacteria bacterium]|nr:hypothetical protein [Gammaproteobacteria bacterium]